MLTNKPICRADLWPLNRSHLRAQRKGRKRRVYETPRPHGVKMNKSAKLAIFRERNRNLARGLLDSYVSGAELQRLVLITLLASGENGASCNDRCNSDNALQTPP